MLHWGLNIALGIEMQMMLSWGLHVALGIELRIMLHWGLSSGSCGSPCSPKTNAGLMYLLMTRGQVMAWVYSHAYSASAFEAEIHIWVRLQNEPFYVTGKCKAIDTQKVFSNKLAVTGKYGDM